MSSYRMRPPSTAAAHEAQNSKNIDRKTHRSLDSEIDVETLRVELRAPQHRVMTPTLEYLARTLMCSVYIEDIHGRLLFAPRQPAADDWRDDFTPLSAPTARDQATALATWCRQASAYAMLTGDRSVRYQRTVIPLVYHGTAFAFIHFVNSPPSGSGFPSLREELVATIADKLYMLFFGEMNEHREKTALRADTSPWSPPTNGTSPDARATNQSGDEWTHCVCLRTSFRLPSENPTVDYTSIARRVGWTLAEHLEGEWSDILATQVSAAETVSGVELSIHGTTGAGMDLSSAAAMIRRVLRRLQWHLTVGIGTAPAKSLSVESSLHIDDRACREASVMLALADRTAAGDGQVLTRREAPASALLHFRDDNHSFRAYASFIEHELKRAEPELETTARTYAQNDCNASATAEALRVDRRTISDRLHRISHLTGLEIPSFTSKVIIYLAFLSPHRDGWSTTSQVGPLRPRTAPPRDSDTRNKPS